MRFMEPRRATIRITPSASHCFPAPCWRLRKFWACRNVFHCHDWQSALIPVLLRTVYAEDPAFREAGTVFTIHNMGYQGLFPPETLPLLMLPWDLFTMSKMEFFGQVNFLKGALTYSDYVTTVSKKYSQEIQTAEYGFGLEGVLRDRAATVTGILNGVDYDEWSPQADKFIAAKYSPQDLSGKAKCKQDLLAAFGVKNADAKLPVIGIVSRFAAQKGFDLIAQIMDRLAREEMIMVVLGSAPGVVVEIGAPHDAQARLATATTASAATSHCSNFPPEAGAAWGAC